MRSVRPSCLVGAASVGGAFTRGVLAALAKAVQERHGLGARPIVLALSNPTSRAECSYQEAYDATQVSFIICIFIALLGSILRPSPR